MAKDKEIVKEDAFVNTMLDFYKRLFSYHLHIIFALIVVILLVAAYGIKSYVDSSRLDTAWAEFWNADHAYMEELNKTDNPDQKKAVGQFIESLSKLTQEFPNTKATPFIMLKHAGMLYYNALNASKKEDMQAAIAIYNDILSKYPSHPVKDIVRESLAYAYESSGDMDNAVKNYDMVAQSGSYLKEEAKINKARCLETKGDISSAENVYKEILQKYPSGDNASQNPDSWSYWAEMAKSRLEDISLQKRRL